MEKCVLCNGRQKFFNATNHLSKLDTTIDYFEVVALIDAFFNEFRNVTFTIQKSIGNDLEGKEIYNQSVEQFLKNDILQWMITKRNSVIKEKSVELQKKIEVMYHSSLDTEKKAVTMDISNWDNVSDFEAFIRENWDFKYLENFISTKLVFLIDVEEIDLLKRIDDALESMINFLDDLSKRMGAENCVKCEMFHKKIVDNLRKFKGVQFTNTKDYIYDMEKDVLIEFGRSQARIGTSAMSSTSLRIDMDSAFNNMNIKMGDDNFEKFVYMHYFLFFMNGNREIMPTFFLKYQDNTISIDSFVAESKSTYYRKLFEIREQIVKGEIIEVMFVGEMFESSARFQRHEERMANSSNEFLIFYSVDKDLNVNYVLIPSEKEKLCLCVNMLKRKKVQYNNVKSNQVKFLIKSFAAKYHIYLNLDKI